MPTTPNRSDTSAPDTSNEALTKVWVAFQAQGGLEVAPGESLTMEALPNTLPPPSGSLGPASLEIEGLERLNLEGPTATFSKRELLGRGGMGEVHLAVDRSLRREVAVKTVSSGSGSQGDRALVQEALYTGFLDHPNVVPVHRLGADETGLPVLVMKRVVGTSWNDLLRDPDHAGWASLSEDRARANLEILLQVCNAVHYAHSRGILHRDIKPANVMVGEFGEVYLVDWGLAIRLDRVEHAPAGLVGTLAYMAPEMLDGAARVSERTDVYLLGATLHRVLTGRPRHAGESHYNVMLRAHLSEPHAYGDDVPRELADLCNHATAADPAQRPQSALDVRKAVERFLEHRHSVELAQRAKAKLVALEAAYLDPESQEGASLFAACRFGYEQALHIWAGNEPAQDGLQRCLELTIERGLEQRNHGLVEALLPTLPRARPDLEERFKALKAAVGAEAEAGARLQALQRDLDLNVGGRQRAGLLGLATLVIYGLTVALAVSNHTGALPFSYPLAFQFGTLIGVLLLVHLLLGRRWLLSNRINRKLIQHLAAGWGCCMMHVALCWVYDLSYRILIMYVGVILTVVIASMAISLDKRLWVAVGIGVLALFSGVVDSTINPMAVHAVAGTSICVYIAITWYRDPPTEA